MPLVAWFKRRPTGREFRRPNFLWPLLALSLSVSGLPAEETDHGAFVQRVRCLEVPEQSYALYLPPGYSADRVWPIVYCFDPGARGRLPVERFQAAAERLGYILVGSYNSRNGDMDISLRAANAMLRDTAQRFKIDERRRYTTGCSGGARVACLVASEYRLSGVVASAAGFPGGVTPADVPFAFFGVVGREDFNYLEMRGVQKDLQARTGPHRLAIFEGTHGWLPAALAGQALEWMDVQAMRSGFIPKQEVWLKETFQNRVQEAQAKTDIGQSYEECLELTADYRGLVDTSGLEAWLAAQRETKAVRSHLAAEKKALKENERWRERFAVAIDQAMQETPNPTDGPNAHLGFPGRTEAPRMSWDKPAAGDTEEFGRPVRAREGFEWKETDRYALLKREAQEAGRLWDRSIGVRRALRAAAGSVGEQAAGKFFLKEYDEAGELLTVGIILQPEESLFHFRLAWVRALQGRKKEAWVHLENATKRGFSDQAQVRELTRVLSSSEKNTTMLEPMFITTKREFATSFGLGLHIYADPETRELIKIIIVRVLPDTEAATLGLGQQEQILRVNGRSIRSFSADFSPDGEFCRVFSKRRSGDRIDLEIMDPADGKTRLVSLTQGRTAQQVRYPWLLAE